MEYFNCIHYLFRYSCAKIVFFCLSSKFSYKKPQRESAEVIELKRLIFLARQETGAIFVGIMKHPEVFDGETLIATCCGAVDDDEVDFTHDCTNKVELIAVKMAMMI